MSEAKGIIIDTTDNTPMPGVVVFNTVSRKSTTTDSNGVFTLPDSSGATLSFRMFSYETLNVLGSADAMTYKMVPVEKVLDTTVATSCYKKNYIRENGACAFSWKAFLDNNKWWFVAGLVFLLLTILIIAKWPQIKAKLS